MLTWCLLLPYRDCSINICNRVLFALGRDRWCLGALHFAKGMLSRGSKRFLNVCRVQGKAEHLTRCISAFPHTPL